MAVINEEDYLAHYGILRRSGRYPWGSGGSQNTRNKTFLEMTDDLKRQGFSESEICVAFGIGTTDRNGVFRPSTTALRSARSVAKHQQKAAEIAMAQRLHDKGYSNVAIGERMGKPESSVRALLAPGAKDKNDKLVAIANVLKSEVDGAQREGHLGLIDVGSGVENHIGVSKESLSNAVFMLKEQGYETHVVPIRQIGTGKDTKTKVLCPPGTTQRDAWLNRDKIQQLSSKAEDGGRYFPTKHDIVSISPNRISVRYAEQGGTNADGVLYVRPGVPDLSLGNARYAQVRVKVGEEHYLKGMAMYKDDLPPGTDIMFNTSKSSTGNKLDAMKKLKDDPDLPFESVVRPLVLDANTPRERVESAMNIVNEEGDWGKWSKNISSQFLSKQDRTLAKERLDETHDRRKREFEEIMQLTNPAVKKKLLESFADATDTAAADLKAASLPRSNWRAILPIETLNPSHVYAPTYRDGEKVVLIRYPHGGKFEIPELTVNNRHPEAKKLLPDAKDAIGIHPSVAARLSGADFDGDTVMVIPNAQRKVKSDPALEGLKNFDPKTSYPGYPGMKKMSAGAKQQEMGNISNLITDMTLHGAPHSEIARAVRHSMVVIDAEKHGLNYRQSAIDNGIAQLKEKYQGGKKAGASTIISRKKSVEFRPETRERRASEGGPVDRTTGRKVLVPTGRMKKNTKGELVPVMEKVRKLAVTDDAHSLVSEARTPMERLYADYSNKQKSLANEARLAALKTPATTWSPSARKTYSKQVSSLDHKLALIKRNRSLERQALVSANAVIKAKREANPNLDGDSLKKIEFQALAEARTRFKVSQTKVVIDADEWDAIQAGAISNHKLTQILAKADLDVIREFATPRTKLLMSPYKKRRAQSMLANGATRAEVADALGVSLSTLDRSLSE